MGRIEARILHADLLSSHNCFSLASQVWNKARREETTLAGFIYRGQPPVYDYFSTLLKLPNLLEQAYQLNLKRRVVREDDLGILADLDRNNLFTFTINDVSLSEIAAIGANDQNLSTAQLARIGRFFSPTWQARMLGRERWEDRWLRDWTVALAVQSALEEIREGRNRCPKPLRPLRSSIVGFLDYYTSMMIDDSLPTEDDVWLLWNAGIRAPYLMHAMAAYLPARLGITPASAGQIFQGRADRTPFPKISHAFEDRLIKYSKGAFRPDLADRLGEIQFNKKESNGAAGSIREFYGRQTPQTSERIKAHDVSLRLIERLKRYHPALIEDLSRSKEGCIKIELPSNHVISQAMVYHDNRQTLMFALSVREPNARLLLEIDPTGNKLVEGPQVYGLPTLLTKSGHYLVDQLLDHLLTPLLEALKTRHPQIEPLPLPVKKIVETGESLPETAPTLKDSPRHLQVPRVLSPLTQVLSAAFRESLPVRDLPIKRTRVVVTSEEEILEKIERGLGRNIGTQRRNRGIRAIRMFEQGGPVKSLHSNPPQLEVRAGDDRFIVRHLGDNYYSVDKVVRRDEAFKPRRQWLLG